MGLAKPNSASSSNQVPDLFQAKRLLCVQPHYDDNDLGAGGTLAALADAGVELIYFTITDDLVGVTDPLLSPERATQKLRKEQLDAARIIGVQQHLWLDLPDAGGYDYFEMRRQIIRTIRLLRPDFLMTCDPWLLYEAHRDHVQTGMAVAEASYLHAMIRLPTDPLVDDTYEPYIIQGVAFYFTCWPNITVDITSTRQRKHRAIQCYQSQFSSLEMEQIINQIAEGEKISGQGSSFEYGEGLKILKPSQLHITPQAWKS